MSWRALLAEALHGLTPGPICALDAAALDATAAALAPKGLLHTTVQLCETHAHTASPVQLVVVMDALNGLNAAQARSLLTRTRDFISPRIVVIATAHCALERLAFLAIGFEALGVDATQNITIFRFDLNTYKHVPDWLNARYWAHPERWKP